MKTSAKAYTVGLHLLKIYRSSVFKSTRTEYILSKIYLNDERVHNYLMHILSRNRNVSAASR